MAAPRCLGLLPAALLVLSGCQQGARTHTASLNHNQFYVVMVPAAAAERTAAISVSSVGGPIDVHVILETDEDAARRAAGTVLATQRPPAGALLSKMKVAQADLEVAIPSQKGFAVLFCNPHDKAASLTAKVASR